MSSKQWDPETVFDLFGDETARGVLLLSQRPRSAEDLAEELDVSLPTVYRRTKQLTKFGLLAEHVRADENKNRYRVFETTLDRLSVALDEEGFHVDVDTTGQLDDRFRAFWTDLGGSGSGERAATGIADGEGLPNRS
ncbi:winged helix-turn-helix domain-containing protein [Haloparvum sedimenti]|uniref:winged helix-turn-helix domain-containing protein n=1 Tax=Haloparvum sedimenti TaxID=1678448 RepID=UPI00071E858F|nr:winged helix-turn-helix domain-containing protein [Haloparvum sedimenti]